MLRRLQKARADARIHLAVDLPNAVVKEKGRFAADHVRRPLDVGLVQPNAFTVDLVATEQALAAFHRDWSARLDAEIDWMRRLAPDLVIGDIPYIPFAAARRLGLPSVAVASLTWDAVLAAYFPVDRAPFRDWYHQIRDAYADAERAIHPAPSVEGCPFINAIHVDPIHEPILGRPAWVRECFGIPATDTRPLVLVTTGGLAADLPLAAMQRLTDVLWLVTVPQTWSAPHIYSTRRSGGPSFGDALATADLVIAKLGYNTVVEAVAAGVPVLYLRRGRFPDEQPIVDWLSRYGAGSEMPLELFQSGQLEGPVASMLGQRGTQQAFAGAEQAANAILAWL